MSKSRPARPQRARMRCAIYTRKSTEEGLEQEFNSLDAQRESGEAFVKSQAHEGWECLPGQFDDGGFTGGNMERPALQRLIAAIEAGEVDCVVVYKVDRLSRSLLDFARMMAVFEKHHVSFVSVTQQFNTATSMGRLVLNVLLSFAQFEREIISERTRDKIAAARRKGKWAGGHPLLGYDIDPRGFKLVVNEDEAFQVRAIFDLYLANQAMLPVIMELDERGWRNKRWTTRKGRERGGKLFTKTSLHNLLTNVTYAGKVRYKNEVHDGEHVAIVPADVWQQVQATLQRNGRTGGALVRNQFGALLKGVVRCAPCDCAMTPTHTTKGGNKRYRYYVCSAAQKRGWHTCPSKSIPAGEIERFVVEQIKEMGTDPMLLKKTVDEVNAVSRTQAQALTTQRQGISRDLRSWHAEVASLAGVAGSPAVARLADLQERIRVAEARLAELDAQITALGRQVVAEPEVAQALADFEPLWNGLTHREQARIVQLLVARVDYDGATSKVSINFRATGLRAWADESKQTLTEQKP